MTRRRCVGSANPNIHAVRQIKENLDELADGLLAAPQAWFVHNSPSNAGWIFLHRWGPQEYYGSGFEVDVLVAVWREAKEIAGL